MENTQKIEDNNIDLSQKPTESQIQDLIKNAIDKDYNKANQVFGEVMTIKLSDLMDQEKIKMADQIHNDAEPEEEGDEESEEQTDEDNEVEEEDSEAEEDENEHTHDDGTTHSHPGGDQEHTHEEDFEGAAV